MSQAQIGIMIEGQMGLNWQNWEAILRTAEDSGYQCVFRSDHFTNPQGPYEDALELWTSLTFAAQITERIELGPLVTPITFRHPSFIAKYASSVHDLSAGRLVLGMGTGWQDREHEAFGLHFPELAERYERLEEGLEIATRLFHNDDPVSYQGHHYTLRDAKLLPKRDQGPLILVGGNGPKKTMPLAAKYAREWNAVYLDRETFKERNAHLDNLMQEAGREPSDIKRSLMTRVLYGKDDAAVAKKLAGTSQSAEELKARGLMVGTASEVVDQLGEWVACGVERFMLQWIEIDDLDSMEDMAANVLPHFHTDA